MAKSEAAPVALDYAPPEEPELRSQLEHHFRWLSRRHHNLLGIGVGPRIRGGEPEPEIAIRLIVASKPRVRGKLPAGEPRLPEFLPIWTSVLGRKLCLMIPTDISQQISVRKVSFGVDGGQATALATWGDAQGLQQFGVITAAHCLPEVGQTVKVSTRSGVIRAPVIARSDVSRDGFDIGLARLDCPVEDIANAAHGSAPSITIPELVNVLGTGRDDQLQAPMRFWNDADPGELIGLCYYWLYAARSGGQPLVMRDAVEVVAEPGTFVKGLSGSPLAIELKGDETKIACLAGYASQDGHLCIGTLFRAGIAWLRSSRTELAGLHTFWAMQELGR